jgi:60 kDa SS-A/Ro ribonucleoprotein
MKTNSVVKQPKIVTHEGGHAVHINAESMLRRSVMSCLLWESEFYEDGKTISERICELVPTVKPAVVAAIAVEAREKMKLRHVPLLLVREMVRHASHRPFVTETLARVAQRADEPAEFLSIYWKDGKSPLAHSVRRGLGLALRKFSEYDFGKYRGDGNAIKLRDVFRIVRPLPADDEQAELWRKVVKGELSTPDTWEVALSAKDGLSKVEKWTRLLNDNRLGALALLRNLRNMEQEGVDSGLIRSAITHSGVGRVLPFRFIAAARYAPQYEPQLEKKLFESVGDNRLLGRTVILVDISSSMETKLSSKSDMSRMDAACGVAMVGREMCEDVAVFSFSNALSLVPPRRGFALRDTIVNSQPHSGTYLGGALSSLHQMGHYDRIIVITDEQTADQIPDPKGKGYVINVASAQNGVGYGAWTHLDGFSEAVFSYIVEAEGKGDE